MVQDVYGRGTEREKQEKENELNNKNIMTTYGTTIAKASEKDFEKVYNLLQPMEELFNSHWSNEEAWTEWADIENNE